MLRFKLFIFLVALPGLGLSQDASTLKSQFNHFFEKEEFETAINYGLQYLELKPADHSLHLDVALAYFHMGEFAQSEGHLHAIMREDKRSAATCHFWLGRQYHLQHLFSKSIDHYKRFLHLSSAKDIKRKQVTDFLLHAANGLKYRVPDQSTLVENMGDAVNSSQQEFGPLESANVDSRIYYSTNQQAIMVDQFDESGSLVSSRREHNYNILFTSIENGTWGAPEVMNPSLNTTEDEILLELNEDGSIVYFQQIRDGQSDYKQDTFGTAENENGVIWEQHPFDQHPVSGMYFFSDSVLIFSSNGFNGFGGYDLFLSIFSEQAWCDPINLGPEINSAFDEITPFLSTDGRNLYFSSNRTSGIGGLDIFHATYVDRTLSWQVENLGLPINSASDEYCYRQTRNGTQAFLSSNRPGGLGGFDLYSVYFQSPKFEQLNQSIPSYFLQVPDYQQFIAQFEDQPETITPESSFEVPQLFYQDNSPLLTERNSEKINQLVGFLQSYSHLTLEILSFSDQEAVSNFDLFFSAQRAEEIKAYIVEKDISEDRIFIKAYGGNYPMAHNEIGGQQSPASQYFNRRLDFVLHNANNLPVRIAYAQPSISPAFENEANKTFYENRQSLNFAIEFARLNQMYKGSVIAQFDDCYISIQPDQPDSYVYACGLFEKFEDALQRLSQIRELGINTSVIVPQINGITIANSAIDESMIRAFPQLKEYLIYLE